MGPWLLAGSSVMLCAAGELIMQVNLAEADSSMLRVSIRYLLLCLGRQDAAQRGRLGASTFRRLNLGLAAMSVAVGMSSWSPPLWPTLVGSVGIGAYCLYQYANTEKNK